MPPKNKKKETPSPSKAAPDVDNLTPEGRHLFAYFSEQIESIKSTYLGKLSEKENEIASLRNEIHSLHKRVVRLDSKITDVEVCERKDNIIVSGDDLPSAVPGEIGIKVICSTLKKSLKLEVSPGDISGCQRMGKKLPTQQEDRRRMLVTLKRRDLKHDIFNACKQLRPKLFITEDLIPTRNTILFALRQAKRQFSNKILGCSTYDGRVFAWTPPNASSSTSNNIRTAINSREDLEEFCLKVLGSPASVLENVNWPK